MSESKHTREPWQIQNHRVIGPDNEQVAGTYNQRLLKDSKVISVAEQDANADRIVDCVNACAGIEKPQQAIPKMIKDRDILVEALREICHKAEFPMRNGPEDYLIGCNESFKECAGIAREALAMVRGK